MNFLQPGFAQPIWSVLHSTQRIMIRAAQQGQRLPGGPAAAIADPGYRPYVQWGEGHQGQRALCRLSNQDMRGARLEGQCHFLG